MKYSTISAIVLILLGMSLISIQAGAEGTSPTYSGDFLDRSTLTGDWGGARNDLAAKGVTIDMSLTQVGQGVVDGGKDSDWEYGGRGDLTLNLDSQKLGLWPGGFFNLEVEGNFSEAVNLNTGALMPVNTNQIFPVPGGDNLNVVSLNFAQFLSHYFGLTIGKYATITATSGDMNEFAHGKGDTQFMNTAFNVNPALLLTVPYSTLGAGAIILPTKDPNEALVTFFVLQSNGSAESSGFEDLDADELTFAAEGRVRTDFFGHTGHQLVGATYSNRNFTSLDQNLRFIIENRAIEEQDDSWSVYYNFDQYLYEPNKGSGQGVGLFGRFGMSDGNPNPMRYFYSLGIGGKGIFTSRPLDRFGIGYYYIDVTSPKFTGLVTSESLLRNEYGFEAFYDIALTPWMQLTPDIQVVRPSQKQEVVRILPLTLKDIDTAIVLGVRLQIIF